jgi:serine/threonine-protein kinase HipA
MEMVARVDVAQILLWDREVAAISWDNSRNLGFFQFHPDFLTSNIQIAPVTMPLSPQVYSFPGLPKDTFRGLPGLVSDSLPDRFGNALIDQWLARQGRSLASFSPVERLCYIGVRGMGALEYRPILHPPASSRSTSIELQELVELANTMLAKRASLRTRWTEADEVNRQAMDHMLRVGTSAGGARAKAVIAWNPTTNEIRSGQAKVPEGFEHWLLKFDGVHGNRDKESQDIPSYGKIEYAYSLMARVAGITMMDCQLLPENGRNHFMTRRFDRLPDGQKLHMLSLCAMGHFDFNMAGGYSYEQAMSLIQQMGMGHGAIVEMYRRMLFNIVGRNQDDHTRNTAFLMDKTGKWTLAPAFDLTYSYNPDGAWTNTHQMTANGKRDQFTPEDLEAVARPFRIRTWKTVLDQVCQAISEWPKLAQRVGVPKTIAAEISKTHRLYLHK